VARLIAGVVQAIGGAEDLPSLQEVVVVWATSNLPIRSCTFLLSDVDGRAAPLPSAGDVANWRPGADASTRRLDLPMLAGDHAVGTLSLFADTKSSGTLDDDNLRLALSHHL